MKDKLKGKGCGCKGDDKECGCVSTGKCNCNERPTVNIVVVKRNTRKKIVKDTKRR